MKTLPSWPSINEALNSLSESVKDQPFDAL